jgi:hypothetical protein
MDLCDAYRPSRLSALLWSLMAESMGTALSERLLAGQKRGMPQSDELLGLASAVMNAAQARFVAFISRSFSWATVQTRLRMTSSIP